MLDLAGGGVPGWRFLLVGQGAPATTTGAEVVSGYVSSDFLVGAVRGSAATVLPNRVAAWRQALVELTDPAIRTRLAVAAEHRVWADHRRFAAAVRGLAGATAGEPAQSRS